MKRSMLAAALAALVAYGCTDNKDRKATDANVATTTTALAPPTSIPVTTTSRSSPAVPRLERVLADLLQRRNEAFAAPDPAKADEYLSADCTCYKAERDSLANLHDKGWRWASPMFEVLGVRLEKQLRAELVSLTVVASRPSEKVIDASGALAVPAGAGQPPTGYGYVLTQQDGVWKIADTYKLDLTTELLHRIVSQGVPS